MLAAGAWSAGIVDAQSVSPSATSAASAAPAKLPASVTPDAAGTDSETKTDSNILLAGCSSCSGGLLGGGGSDSSEGGGCSSCGSGECADGCLPGRFKRCSCCEGDSVATRALCGLYNCICCPDPCYEPRWIAAANAAFFVDSARPQTQITIRMDGNYDVAHPDRAEFWIPRTAASNGLAAILCAPAGFGKGPTYVSHTADIEELMMHVEGAIGTVGTFVDTTYREFGPNGSAVNTAGGWQNNVCNTSGFGDVTIGAKTVLLDCELLLVTSQFKTFLPAGQFSKNLGTGHVSLEPSVLFTVKLMPDTYMQGQLAYWIPIAGDPLYAADVFHMHLSFNRVLYRFLPDVQLIGTMEMNEWSTIGGDYTAEFLVPGKKIAQPSGSGGCMFSTGPGVRLNVCDRMDIGVGTAFALTGPRWAQEEVRAEFRWRF
jgi:hypothetical protein